MSEFVQQDAPDHLPVEIYARERGHPRTQHSFAIFNRQLDAVGRLALRVALAFAADLRDHAAKDAVGVGAHLQPDGSARAHIADFALRHVDAQQQLACVGDAANLRALLKELTCQARQLFTKNPARARRRQIELRAFAGEHRAARFERRQ